MKEQVFSRVGCYVRVSTENQLENYSIEEQTGRLRAYCAAKGWGIYRVYTDGGYSGGNSNRPALQEMLADVRAGKLDMVAVYKLDRLSRSQKDTLTIIEDELIANHVEFVSMSENFDTSTPFGRAMIGILSVFAQLEKDQITERFTMGRIGRSRAGYYHGGPTPPTGYRYIGGELVVDEYQAAQVREVYRLFLDGLGISSIARKMHEKYGGWGSHALVRNVLCNPVYIGKVRFMGREYEGQHRPILAQDVFFRAQERLGNLRQEGTAPFRAGYLLSGLLFCEECGARYIVNHGCYKCYSRAKSDKRYVVDPDCPNRDYRVGELDGLIIAELKKLDYSAWREKGGKETIPPDSGQALPARIRELDSQMGRLLDLYQVGSVPADQVSLRASALQKEKEALEELLARRSEEQPVSPAWEIGAGLDGLFSKGTLEERRLFVTSLIQSVGIEGDTVKIRWRI